MKDVKQYGEQGFTMLEMLFSFTIFCVIVTLFPTFIGMVLQGPTDSRLQRFEWEVFVSQIKKEIRFVDQLYVEGNIVYLQKESDIVTYELYQDKLRRRVNGMGHEVLLQNVANIRFEEIVNGVQLTVTDHRENIYQAQLRSFIDITKRADER